jgi:hypothetical protein
VPATPAKKPPQHLEYCAFPILRQRRKAMTKRELIDTGTDKRFVL